METKIDTLSKAQIRKYHPIQEEKKRCVTTQITAKRARQNTNLYIIPLIVVEWIVQF